MFLYLMTISLPFILFRLLSLGCPFCRLEVHGSSLLWSLLPVSFQGFLVRGTCVCVLVSGAAFFSQECNEVSSNEFLGYLCVWYGFGQPVF